ncbi:hypothetical protein WISP_05285 [Willisornis vidua]|uniref:MACF1 factor n=1 Tax=Willisornis vidua TaxID=1566151 RepID=A0ABQ9DT22_9PASS|nr:hypothetical protein WISP_05285 [Willisornis vidua]
MGNSVSRPSCLGEKSRRPEELLREPPCREPGLDEGQLPAGSVTEAWPGLLEKAPVPVENGWSPVPSAIRSRPGSPVLRRSQSEVAVQNGGTVGVPVKGQAGGATWTPPRASVPRSTWSWKPVTTREVTEVTEVTETIVTEIVEVTEYPAGEKGGDPVVTRTVTVLTERVGELAATGCAGHADVIEVSPRAIPIAEEVVGGERGQETLERLLAWVADMEELVSNQKPPSAEAKVAKAQLEEQKLLKRLLEEWRPRVELVLQDRLTAHGSSTAASEGSTGLSDLGERWEKLMQEAEARYGCLERILPAAQGFQEAMDAFQEWLSAMERQLAQLWHTDGCVGRVQDAHRQTQALCEEIRGRLGELDSALESGQKVLEMVTGEEAQLVQEKMESLRMRYLIVGQSSADTAHRLGQTLEASSRLGTAPEDLALWLGRMEKELGERESQDDGQEPLVSAGDREKFEQVLDSQLARVAELSERLEEIGRVQLDSEALSSQLSEQKLLSAEILHCRGLVERLLGISDLLLRCCPEPLQQRLQPLVQALRERMEQLSLRSGACAVQLEHAQSLLTQFSEALEELLPWLEETQALGVQLSPNAISYEAFKEQQALLQSLREAIAEHRPLVGKLQRVSAQLLELSPEQGAPFQRRWQEAEEQYGCIREHVRQAAALLEDALPRYSQLTERMDMLLECLERLQSRLQSQPPVRGDTAHLREQIRENSLALGELEKLGVALKGVQAQGEELLATMQAVSSDAAARGIQERTAQLLSQWDSLRGRCQEQEQWLRELLTLAERFWHGLSELALALSDTQQLVLGLEEANGEPEAIRARLRTMQALREEIDALQGELDTLGSLGVELMASCGDPDKPDVTKSLDDLYSSWHSLSRVWTERNGRLEEQLQAALSYQDTMQRLLEWLDTAELRIAEEFLVGGDLDMVQQQLAELKEFKRELYQCKVDVESLRHQGGGGQGDPPAALSDFRQRWDHLEEEIVSRQHQLEAALLGLGQFQHQLAELLQWLSRTGEQLRGPAPLRPDLQSCEIELAKHKVLRTDVMSHARTVQSVTEAGQGLLLSSLGESVEGLQRSLQQLGQHWDLVRSETESRQLELENNLSQVQDITLEITELLQWLEQVELQLFCSKPAWGHPDATKEKLNTHLVSTGTGPDPCVGLQHKLEENLLFSGKFTDALQALMDWLYRAEPQLSEDVPVGGDRDLVGDLMDKHKVFQKELGKRASCIKTLKRSVRDLTRGSSSVDSQWLQRQVEELSTRWDLVCKLSLSKQARLEAALRQAEEFHTLVHSFLGRLSESEKTLKYGVFPEEEAAVKECQSQLQELMQSLQCQQLELECITSLGEEILATCHPDSVITIKSWVTVAKSRFQEVLSWAQQQGERLRAQAAVLAAEREETTQLMDWITAAEEALGLRDQEPLPEEAEQLEELIAQHVVFMEELNRKQPDVEKVTKSCKRKLAADLGPPATRRLPTRRRSSGKAQGAAAVPLVGLEPQTPLMAQLLHRWQQLWLLALDRQYRLETALQRLKELEEFAHFDFGVWRKRYMQWISQMKSRVLDVFRGIDRDQDGRISQREFIESVLASKFPTNVLEMNAVATIFDMNGDGFIDYYEFVSALHPNRDPLRRSADADQIQDEVWWGAVVGRAGRVGNLPGAELRVSLQVNRQVAQCNCAKRFQVEQISANRYRFGESQQLRMVRILRSTLMVRVGGGWIALDEFLVKNDPCRVKGRTNLKINEKYLSPDTFGAAARCAGNQSAASSKVLSPSRSNSSLSLYSSASAPSSPMARKSVLRRTRSGDRCPRSRGSGLPDGAELHFSAAEESLAVVPPESWELWKVCSGRMESKPAVNGHVVPSSPGEDMPGKNHLCQDVMPRKQPKAAGRDVAEPGAPGEPSEAAGSIAGVYVEASKKIMSFYEATREHLLSLDPALSLLEAQAATGSIADPVTHRHVSVAEAVRLGLVGLELKERLLAAERAATGFLDPYTEEKIPLYQAMQKELVGREQGIRLLQAQMATGGIIDPATGARLPVDVACERGYLDEEMSQLLSDPSHEDSKGFLDPSTTEKVSYSELRKRCVVDPASGFLLLPLQITFPGLGGRVSSRDLLDSGIISHDVFRGLEEGRVSTQELAENDVVQQFLHGTRSVAGVVLPSGEQKSLYQALREHLLVPGAALMLLQVQASTGSLTDPLKNKTYSVDESVRVGLIGPELYEKLSSAEKTITGYRDPSTGEMLSLFQAIRKGFVPRDHGLCLLEAQMATGGVIAPGRYLRVPTETACEWGYLDEATRQLLSSPPDHMKGFFDPSSKEKLSYAGLLQRCVTDPTTGLLLLPLGGDRGEGSQGTHLFFNHEVQMALEKTQMPIAVGKFKGKSVSVWKLLFSDYIQGEQRAALAQQFLVGTLSTQGLGEAVRAAVEETASTANVTFEGLRDQVTADQLLNSEIINKDLFKKLKEGETSAKEVVGMDTVRKYLQGTGSIGGLLLPDSQEKISIYQAKRKGLLRPGTSLILLEAQAATGFVIDPAANKRYSVDEALRANVIGPDVYDKLLAAEKSVTGYRDPYSGSKISLFQAMQKELIVKEHGIRLLEAQIATGGIIDPVNSHRIPVEVAYKRGYFDKKMNLILSDPSDDTKGFFDPNTHENLTYLQLKEKCITEPSTGLCLLPLNSRKRQFIDEATRQVFRSSWLPVRFGRLRGEKVSVWDLLNSEYFTEGRRREIFNHFQLRKLSLEQIRAMLEEEMKKWAPIKFPAIRGSVSAYHLMETGVIDRVLFEKVLEGSVTPEQVLHMDSVRKYLYGSGSIGGIVLQPSNQRMSIYEAMKQNIVVPGVALPLLEAQAATGFIIDPVNNQKLRVDEAVREGVIGPDVHEKLQHAEGAVTGYKDPFTGKKIPLFQAMKKGLIADKQAMQLMEVQMATGGIIDPTCGHYIPLQSAQQRGCLDEDTSKALSKPSDEHRAFCLPDSKESVTYAELIQRCQKDNASGFHLLPLSQTAAPAYTDEQIQKIFKETMVKEKGVSLWELIHSGYFTEEQRSDFMERFRSEELSLQQLVALVLRLVGDMEMKARTQISLEGLRGSVPVVWLLDTGIISEKTFEELAQGIRTPEEVAAMESVKRYLQGTGSIAGVFIEASKQKMSFYDAMKNNLLLPGAALRLLEAQAATGYLTDPATNRRLSVRDAVRAAVVGEELTEKLLLAERAVMGYTDPYTGSSISLCQALRKELIPLGEAVPLLEAQLATGGVIDPIHHLHLPLQAACRYGFYDEDMNQTLSQLEDSTKVFFDPNTKENVTYQQLKERCVRDAESGLWLLPLSENAMFCVDEQTMEVLKSVSVCVNVGRFKGQTVSVWDLLNSEYFSDNKRRELVQKYKDEKTEVLQEITTIITTIIQETEAQGKKFAFKGLRKRVSASDLFQSQLIDKKTLDELNQGKKTVKEVTEMESVRRYLEGSNFIAGVLIQPSNEKMSIYQAMWKGILRPGTALVLLEAQAATGYIIDPERNKKFSVEEALKEGLIGGEIFEKLLCAERAVTGYTDPYTKAPMSLFEAMNQGLIVKSHGIRLLEAQIATGGIIDPVHSHRLPVEVAYQRGYFNQEMNQILSDPTDDTKGFFDPNTHENLTYMQLLERCVQDSETGLYMLQVVKEGGKYFYIDESTKQALRSKPLQVKVGKFKGQTVSIWEVLCSHYFSEQKRKELVMQYKSKTLTLENLISLILKIIEDTEQRTEALKVKGLRGEVSVSELFNSEIVDKKTLDQLQDGSLTLSTLTKRDTIQRYLDGTGSIAGVLLPSRKEKMSIYQALKRGLLTEQCALGLLEAQAATGFLIDPLNNQKLSVDEAVSSGLVGSDLREQLLLAEKAVTGYTDPQTGDKISLFQAIRQKRTLRDHGIRLLEAQLATGGIIDPMHSHRLPLDVAYRRGHLDEDMFLLLSDPDHGSKGFIDPNTREKISYSQLLQRCAQDRDSGLYLLQVLEKEDNYFYIDEQTKNALLCTMVQVPVGKYQGQVLSLWELLCSEYITEEKRKELVKKYKADSQHIIQGIIETILKIIRDKEEDRSDVWFQGIRQQITASELLSAKIITEETMEKLNEGKETAKEIAQMDSVRRYLEGTGSIAAKDSYTFRQVRLGCQAADTSAQVSPCQDSWEATGAADTHGAPREQDCPPETTHKMSGRPGNNKPSNTGSNPIAGEHKEMGGGGSNFIAGVFIQAKNKKLSIYEAMVRGLLTPGTALVLLEAQAASGLLTDPRRNEQLSVKAALASGLIGRDFYEKLLSAEGAVTGYTEPYTGHRISLFQAMKQEFIVREHAIRLLQAQLATGGIIDPERGHRVPVEVAFERGYFDQEMRQFLCDPENQTRSCFDPNTHENLTYLYEAGELTLEQVKTVVTTVVTKTVAPRAEQTSPVGGPVAEPMATELEPTPVQGDKAWEETLKVTTVEGSVGEFQGRQVSLWELLFSNYISEEKRQELLELYHEGTLTIQELLSTTSSLMTDSQERHLAALSPQTVDLLRSEGSYITFGPCQEQRVSVWELLSSKQVSEYKREAHLDSYGTGGLTVNKITITTTVITGPQRQKSHQRHH